MEVDHLQYVRFVSTSPNFPGAEQSHGEGLPGNARRKTGPDSPLEMEMFERKPLDQVRLRSPRALELDECMGYQ